MNEHECDDCGAVVQRFTITRGFALVCDQCLMSRMRAEHELALGVARVIADTRGGNR